MGRFYGVRRKTESSRRRSTMTIACILGAFALAAGVGFQFESEVLRLGLGGLFELDHEVIAFAVGELRLAHQGIAFLLERDCRLGVFRRSDDGDRLRGGGDGFQFRVVEVDGDAAVLLDDELGVGRGLFQEAPTFRSRQMGGLIGGSCGEQAGTQGGQRGCGGGGSFSFVWVAADVRRLYSCVVAAVVVSIRASSRRLLRDSIHS